MYEAVETRLDRAAAVKVLPTKFLLDQASAGRFENGSAADRQARAPEHRVDLRHGDRIGHPLDKHPHPSNCAMPSTRPRRCIRSTVDCSRSRWKNYG